MWICWALQAVLSFSAWEKSRDASPNSQNVEDMKFVEHLYNSKRVLKQNIVCCIEYCADLILRASVDRKFSRQRKKRKFWVDDAHWISFSFREAWRLFMHCFWCSPQLCGVMTFAEKINKLRGWILEIYISLLKVVSTYY